MLFPMSYFTPCAHGTIDVVTGVGTDSCSQRRYCQAKKGAHLCHVNGLGDKSFNKTFVTKEPAPNPGIVIVLAVEWVLCHSRGGTYGPAAMSGSLQERRERGKQYIHSPWRVRTRKPVCCSPYCGKFRAYPRVGPLQCSLAVILRKERRLTCCAVPQAHSHPPDG